MKYMDKTEFDKANVFGLGSPNDAYAQYFDGNSFLTLLKSEEVRTDTCKEMETS